MSRAAWRNGLIAAAISWIFLSAIGYAAWKAFS